MKPVSSDGPIYAHIVSNQLKVGDLTFDSNGVKDIVGLRSVLSKLRNLPEKSNFFLGCLLIGRFDGFQALYRHAVK